MIIFDDLLIRKKRGYVYGYDSVIILLPEMKLGKFCEGLLYWVRAKKFRFVCYVWSDILSVSL